MTYHHYCQFHLGDLFPHLMFLRRLGVKYPEHTFNFYVHPCYHKELNPIIEDVMNVNVHPLVNAPAESQDVWKNWNRTWENHPHRYQWAPFYVAWFKFLSNRMQLDCPVNNPGDLLFDYPALRQHEEFDLWPDYGTKPFVLVNNAQPCSGQFRAYSSLDYLDPLIAAIAEKCFVITTQKSKIGVRCTRDIGLDCTRIGRLSMKCDAIVGIVNGPIWMAFNHHNAYCETPKKWLFLRDNGEDMHLMQNEKYAVNLQDAVRVCRELGIA
jgi:hypothetical protein